MADESPWLKAEANTIATVAAGGTEVVVAGRYWVKSVVFFNGVAASAHMELHDHATAATDADPIRVSLPAQASFEVSGPFRFLNGIRAASDASAAGIGVLVVYRALGLG